MYSRLNSWAVFILVMASGLVQATAFDYISILGAKPDLLFTIVVFFSLFSSRRDSIRAALWSGLIEDITSSAVLGGYTVPFLLMALILNYNQAKFYKEKLSMQVLITAASYVFTGFLALSFSSIASRIPVDYTSFLPIVLRSAVYTGVASPVAFFALARWRGRFFYRGARI